MHCEQQSHCPNARCRSGVPGWDNTAGCSRARLAKCCTFHPFTQTQWLTIRANAQKDMIQMMMKDAHLAGSTAQQQCYCHRTQASAAKTRHHRWQCSERMRHTLMHNCCTEPPPIPINSCSTPVKGFLYRKHHTKLLSSSNALNSCFIHCSTATACVVCLSTQAELMETQQQAGILR